MASNRILLDSGALSAWGARDGVVRRYIENAIGKKAEIAIPTVVIAESTTGTAIDAEVHRVLRSLDLLVIPLNEELAREAGALRFAAGRPRRDTIDAIVVATADAQFHTTILTGDPDDLEVLASVRGRSRVVAI